MKHIIRISAVVLLLALSCGHRSSDAQDCYDLCMHLLPIGFETYGDYYCCRPEHGTFATRPCTPFDAGGFDCPSWVLRHLEESGCWAVEPTEGEGVACFPFAIGAAYKELESCNFSKHTCVYGDEVFQFVGGTVCYDCPSDGPPED